jgi:hypothetical protein
MCVNVMFFSLLLSLNRQNPMRDLAILHLYLASLHGPKRGAERKSGLCYHTRACELHEDNQYCKTVQQPQYYAMAATAIVRSATLLVEEGDEATTEIPERCSYNLGSLPPSSTRFPFTE